MILDLRLRIRTRAARSLRRLSPNGLECGEGFVVGVGEGVQVFLGGHDLGVANAFHDGLEIGAAGEEPGGVGVAQVVDADVEVEAGALQGGQPDLGADLPSADGSRRRARARRRHRHRQILRVLSFAPQMPGPGRERADTR